MSSTTILVLSALGISIAFGYLGVMIAWYAGGLMKKELEHEVKAIAATPKKPALKLVISKGD